MRYQRLTWIWGCIGVGVLSCAAAAGSWENDLRAGSLERSRGDITGSLERLQQALATAPDQPSRVRAMTQLGLTLEQAGRLTDAEHLLQSALDQTSGSARATILLAAGNVAAAEHDTARASALYRQILAAADDDPALTDLRVLAQLNLLRLLPEREKLAMLQELSARVAAIQEPGYRARAYFSLGEQLAESADTASYLESAAGAMRSDQIVLLAYRSLSQAQDLARQSGDAPLQIESADAIAQLYESKGRLVDAWKLNQQALDVADRIELGQVEALLVRLEWRAGRLSRQLGNESLALASYLRAARHLEAIRHDLPIEDATGQSTYQTLLRPIFVDLLDLMLVDVDRLSKQEQAARLDSVVDALELTHQAEMQDYLGDRCSVDSIKPLIDAPLDAGIAVVYTVVLKDRLEIVVRSRRGLIHRSVPVAQRTLDTQINDFRAELTDTSSNDYLTTARQLRAWLIDPIEAQLTQWGVHELVIVPDGHLRLIPFAALHDGRQFLAERYVVSTVTGLTMTEASAGRGAQTMSLLAGVSLPGPVIDRLITMGFTGAFASVGDTATRQTALRSELALPGVKPEINQLLAIGGSVPLLNEDFTVARFEREVATGHYRYIHIASHGFFGDSAQASFLLAFDNIIRMDDLQRLIADNGTQGGAIELLTLSACDTATGDDRAPLGFAGAAIRARARSVVGTLWAVSDEASRQFMQVFYAGLPRHSKAQALAQAQRTLIRSEQFSHPYYWAPILLIGNWN